MVVITVGVLALVLFAALGETARRGSASARVVASAEGIALLSLAGVGLLFALSLHGSVCDDGCDPIPGLSWWWHDPQAWQWSAQLVLAVAGFVAVGAAVVLVRACRYRWAAGAMTLAAMSFGAWAAILAPLGDGLGI
jgi:hypothetical protein